MVKVADDNRLFSKLRRQRDQAQGREEELSRKALLKRQSLEPATEPQRSWSRVMSCTNDASNSRHQFFTDSFDFGDKSAAARRELLGYALAAELVSPVQRLGERFRVQTGKTSHTSKQAQKDAQG